jgi:hypothetical protein
MFAAAVLRAHDAKHGGQGQLDRQQRPTQDAFDVHDVPQATVTGRNIDLTKSVTMLLGVKRTLCAMSQFITPGMNTRWPRCIAASSQVARDNSSAGIHISSAGRPVVGAYRRSWPNG